MVILLLSPLASSALAQKYVRGLLTENKENVIHILTAEGEECAYQYADKTPAFAGGVLISLKSLSPGIWVGIEYIPDKTTECPKTSQEEEASDPSSTSTGANDAAEAAEADDAVEVNGFIKSLTVDPSITGIWRNDFAFGIQFSAQAGDFSKQDAVLGYFSDTLISEWGETQKFRWHTFFNLDLVAIPNKEAVADEDGTDDSEGDSSGTSTPVAGTSVASIGMTGALPAVSQQREGNGTDSSFETFLASRKSLALEIGTYLAWEFFAVGDDVLTIGPLLEGGIATITEKDLVASDGTTITVDDTVKHFFAIGARFTHHQRVTQEKVNPEMLRTVDVLYGMFENFRSPTTDDLEPRVLFKAWLRIPGSLPIYTGVAANLGEGPDDLRLFAALQFDLNKIVGAVSPK